MEPLIEVPQVGKVLSFKPQVGKVKMGPTTSGFTTICLPKKKHMKKWVNFINICKIWINTNRIQNFSRPINLVLKTYQKKKKMVLKTNLETKLVSFKKF